MDARHPDIHQNLIRARPRRSPFTQPQYLAPARILDADSLGTSPAEAERYWVRSRLGADLQTASDPRTSAMVVPRRRRNSARSVPALR